VLENRVDDRSERVIVGVVIGGWGRRRFGRWWRLNMGV
jgi:hypothetical protein